MPRDVSHRCWSYGTDWSALERWKVLEYARTRWCTLGDSERVEDVRTLPAFQVNNCRSMRCHQMVLLLPVETKGCFVLQVFVSVVVQTFLWCCRCFCDVADTSVMLQMVLWCCRRCFMLQVFVVLHAWSNVAGIFWCCRLTLVFHVFFVLTFPVSFCS